MDFWNETERQIWAAAFAAHFVTSRSDEMISVENRHQEVADRAVLAYRQTLCAGPDDRSADDVDRAALARLHSRPGAAVGYIEWMADQPCKGNGSGQLCRVNAPNDPTWCCPACRASLLRYGPPKEAR